MRYFGEIAFDGSHFSGWQKNPPYPTVQEKVEEAMKKVLKREIKITGCGRTDAGVHATSFYFHFDIEVPVNEEGLCERLQGILFPHILVKRVFRVGDDAHARHSAVSRAYMYVMLKEKVPFLHRYAYFLWWAPPISYLEECACIIKNTEDFSAFHSTGSTPTSSFVRVYDVRFLECDVYIPPVGLPWTWKVPALCFYIECNRFLYRMVRNIVGSILYFYREGASVKAFEEFVRRGKREGAPPPAPPDGLYLISVKYDERIFHNTHS